MPTPPVDFQLVFQTLPGNLVLLAPDAPDYTILAISDALLRITASTREQVVGHSVFAVYPENPAATSATGPANLRASLDTARRTRQPDQMPLVRYDVAEANGEFEARYWSAHTQPVLDAAGQVQYLLHTTQDVTAAVQTENSQQALREIEQTYSLFLQAPVAVCIVTGPENVVALANDEMRHLLSAAGDLVGTPLAAVLPQVPGVAKVLDQVRKTGQPYAGTEYPVRLRLAGGAEQRYYNFVFQPYFENAEDSTATGVFSVAHEITAQVLARQRIEESEHRYRQLIEEAPVAMALYLGSEIRIQYANDIMLGYWGKGTAVLGQTFRQALPELENQPFPALLERVYATGEAYVGTRELATLLVNGQLQSAYFSYTYKPLRNQQGEVYGIHHTAIDVTEEVLALRKLEAEKQHAELAIEVGALGVFETDFGTPPTMRTDRRLDEIFGFDAPQPRERYLAAYHPDDRPRLDQALTQGLQTGLFEYEVRLRHPSQQVRWVRVQGSVRRDAAGQPTRVLGVVQDTTAQKAFTEALQESEQRFRIMADAAPSMVWAVHPDSTIRYINRAFIEFVGVSQAQYLAEGWASYVPPAELEKAQQALTEAIAQRRVYTLEHRMRRHDGQYRWLLAQGAPSYYPNGELYGYVGSAIDITDLKQANEQLVRINQDLDSFVYASSHDLKQPVNNLAGLLDEMRRAVTFADPAEEALLLPLIEDTLHHLSVTIDDLATLGQAQHVGHAPAETVALAALTEEVLATLEPQVRAAQARITTDFGARPAVSFPRANLRTVLLNLLSNSLKYADPQRPARIHLSVWVEAGQPVLVVEDNGLGFDAERYGPELFHIFRRFHTHTAGTGVGLYLVNRIVQAHGGHIEVDSQVGAGATFRVWLGGA